MKANPDWCRVELSATCTKTQCIGLTYKVRRIKGWAFWQTISHAVSLYDSVSVDCLVSVNSEFQYHKTESLPHATAKVIHSSKCVASTAAKHGETCCHASDNWTSTRFTISRGAAWRTTWRRRKKSGKHCCKNCASNYFSLWQKQMDCRFGRKHQRSINSIQWNIEKDDSCVSECRRRWAGYVNCPKKFTGLVVWDTQWEGLFTVIAEPT